MPVGIRHRRGTARRALPIVRSSRKSSRLSVTLGWRLAIAKTWEFDSPLVGRFSQQTATMGAQRAVPYHHPFKMEIDWRKSQESDLDLGLKYQYSGGSASLVYSDGDTFNRWLNPYPVPPSLI